MSVSFNKDSVFNLKPIGLEQIRGELQGLMIAGEQPMAAFKTVRDQLVFTNKRIVAIDVQGITGKRKAFTSMPYSKVQFFTIQSPGFAEIFSDSELYLVFSDGTTATFEFNGKTDIGMIGRMISEYVLR
ncbi:MAG: PH domain-containing protein [Ruminococcus sp.]|nr:PH domain-containing protein [Ruminococcus sp.]